MPIRGTVKLKSDLQLLEVFQRIQELGPADGVMSETEFHRLTGTETVNSEALGVEQRTSASFDVYREMATRWAESFV